MRAKHLRFDKRNGVFDVYLDGEELDQPMQPMLSANKYKTYRL